MEDQLMWTTPFSFGATQRGKELDYANRKAHAATIAHRRRRQQQKLLTASRTVSQTPSLLCSEPPNQQDGASDESLSQVDESEASRNGDGGTPQREATDPSHAYLSALQMVSRRGMPNDYKVNTLNSFPYHGSSDPFDSQLVPVTPLLMQAISFVRFYMISNCSPSLTLQPSAESLRCKQASPVGSIIGSHAARWMWDMFISDSGTFWSAVASVVPVMRRYLPHESSSELESISLRLKAESFAGLRKKLEDCQNGKATSISVMYHVKTLFREASMTGDISGARSHAQVLCWLAHRLSISSRDIPASRIALYSDAIAALLQLRRPVMPYMEWMPRLRATIWSSAKSVFPCLDLVRTDVPGCIVSLRLRAALLHVREALYVGHVSMFAEKWDSLKRAELLFQWMTTTAEYHICRVLDLYLDLTQQESELELSKGERYMEAAIALALLHTLQKSFCDVVRTDDVDIHESAPTIHPVMLDAVQCAKEHCSKSEWMFYQPAYLWILYVGAYCEERLYIMDRVQCESKTNISQSWFHEKLAEESRRKGLTSWADAKVALNSFVVNEALTPQPQFWYEATVCN